MTRDPESTPPRTRASAATAPAARSAGEKNHTGVPAPRADVGSAATVRTVSDLVGSDSAGAGRAGIPLADILHRMPVIAPGRAAHRVNQRPHRTGLKGGAG